MIVRRVRVEEGFLDGLDVEFSEGLNVIVGPRGAGKTSLIELIRFALDVRGYTDRSERSALEHARSVLGSGEVTVTLEVGDSWIEVARTAAETSSRAAGPYEAPIVLSQNEIESVGLAAPGRLRIVDGFRPSVSDETANDTNVRASIRSLSVELQGLALEISNLEQQLSKLSELREQLASAKKQQDTLTASLKKLTAEQQQLQKLTSDTANNTVRTELLSQALKDLTDWAETIEATVEAAPVIDRWPQEAGAGDALKDARALAQSAVQHLRASLEQVRHAITSADANLSTAKKNKLKLDQSARDVRKILEQSQKGAGDAAKQVSTLQQKVSQLTALQTARDGRIKRRDELSKKRDEMLARLDALRDKRHAARLAVASRLNKRLAPKIRIEVVKSGIFTDYLNAILGSLRGSALHYNSLAPLLASTVSPRELVEAVEHDDVELLAGVADIPEDRAVRLAAHMRTQGLADILTAPLEDSVTLRLLDGGAYKDTEQLSTGQRCTVILPLLLAHDERTIIVDQPEDHLDNAFIVDTVIKAIRARTRGQIIFSTHNANIPVLGNAARVIVLGSDGKNGFVRHSGTLEDDASVQAITSIMEGGREAFQTRATFYGIPSGGDE